MEFDFGTIAGLANTGALALFIILFIRGDIIPKIVVERLLKVYEQQAADWLVQILKAIDKEDAKPPERAT